MDGKQLLKHYADGRRDFSWVDLRGIDLTGACLPDINLYRADLSGAILQHADLRRACLLKTNLIRANLTAANLAGANLRRADLTGTVLIAAILDGVRFSDIALPQGIPSISPSVRQLAMYPSPEPAHHRSVQQPRQNLAVHHPTPEQPPPPSTRRRWSKNVASSQTPLPFPGASSFYRAQAPTLAELPVPSLALLWSGYCCFGGILGIHEVPDVLWLMVWMTALAWMLGESMAWFTPVLAAIAVMLGSGLSLWALMFAGSVSLGLGVGLVMLGWSLSKALKDSLWIGGLIVIVINLSLWLVQGNGPRVVLSGYFPLAFLLLIGMGTSGIGAIAWLQMQKDGFKRKHIAWAFGVCAALGLLCGGIVSRGMLPSL